MAGLSVRDSAFESVEIDEETECIPNRNEDVSLDLLEQQQAREQARLLQRFKELRHKQKVQQETLLSQQQQQIDRLQGEQLIVQSLIASQRGAQWGEGRVTLRESSSMMTPPRRTLENGEKSKAANPGLHAPPPYLSTDSGFMTSMGSTLEQPQEQGGLPRPVLYPSSPSVEEDKYTNPELFSNPGSYADQLQAVDDNPSRFDAPSEGGSDNYYIPPLRPEAAASRPNVAGQSLTTLQALLASTAPNVLQQMLGALPAQQRSMLLEQRQAAVQESASPTFSPTQPPAPRQPAPPPPSAPSRPSGPSYPPAPPRPSYPPGPSLPPVSHSFTNSDVAALLRQTQQLMQAGRFHPATIRHSSGLQSREQDSDRSLGISRGSSFPPSLVPRLGLDAEDSETSRGPRRADLHSAPSASQHLQERLERSQSSQSRQSQRAGPARNSRQSQHNLLGQFQNSSSAASSFRDAAPVDAGRLPASWEEDEDGQQEDYGVRGREEAEEEAEEEDDSDLDITVKHVSSNAEERPISGVQGRKTFEQLLEEQLEHELEQAEEDQRIEEAAKSCQPTGPVKRPFLRKGEGIARFSHPPKPRPPKRHSGGGGQKSESSRSFPVAQSSSSGTLDSEKSSKVQPRRQPERKALPVCRKKTTAKESDPLQPEKLTLIKQKRETTRKPQAAAPARRDPSEDDKDSIADDASFVAGVRQRETAEPLEAEELDEFEALEDIADNMSLVSNSSVVQRLITPNKQRQKNAVSDLKTVLEKKKASVSSPFERNAAMRSLLSAHIRQQPPNQLQEPSDKQQETRGDNSHLSSHTDRHWDSILRDDRLVVTLSSKNKETERTLSERVHPFSDRTDLEDRLVNNRIAPSTDLTTGSEPGVYNSDPSQGLEFSNHFSLFNSNRPASQPPDEAGDGPPSPTKSVTRKVATLQSRLNSANDTAALLQRLSAQAGVLASGFSGPDARGTSWRTDPANQSENDDNSLLSTSVSRPQPVVIGGKKEVREEEEFNDLADRNQRRESDEEDSDDDTVHDDDSDGDQGRQTRGFLPVDNAEDDNNNNNNDDGDNRLDFDDEEEWTSSAPQASSGNTASDSGGAEKDMASTPPTSKLMSRLFPKLKPKPSAEQQQQQETLQRASSTSVGDGVQSRLLREKLAELEAEIEKFRNDNAALDRLTKERKEGVNRLKEEIARFEQEKADELRRLEEFKMQETKKLKQDRKLFETYQRQVRAMPDKKEREEIEALRRQLSDLQAELKQRESRWSSSVSRLKTRLTDLEAENGELKEELRIMEKKRLEWMTHTRANSSKAPNSQATSSKSAPRSSTPTNNMVNGFHENSQPAPLVHRPKAATSGPPAPGPVSKSVVAGKSGWKVGDQSSTGGGGGGESVPRGQPATPSMIEGFSPAANANGDNDNLSFTSTSQPAPRPAVEGPTVDKGNGQYEETQFSDGKVERVYSNGSREVLFANGTRKEISSDGQYFIVSFFNGDIKQVFPDQRVVYYYAESQTTQTTYPDRLEVLQFPNDQTEKHYPDGTHEITFPNQTVKYLFPNGSEESIFPDGTILRVDRNGEKVLELPNGQREIHTHQLKRREYPDGTVKTLHNDGRQETRYSTGRVRLKDKDGNVLLDRMY